MLDVRCRLHETIWQSLQSRCTATCEIIRRSSLEAQTKVAFDKAKVMAVLLEEKIMPH